MAAREVPLCDCPGPSDCPGPCACYAEGYAQGEDLQPHTISPAQFVSAAECAPETPAQPLPDGTKDRVMAASQAFRTDFSDV